MNCFKELLSDFRSLQFNIFCVIQKFKMMFSRILKGGIGTILTFMNLNGKDCSFNIISGKLSTVKIKKCK